MVLGVSEPVLAAMIGAAATITTATVQLIAAWRRHSAEGDRRTSSKKGGFRSLLMLLMIILAAAVAGFAYSQYRLQETREETRALRLETKEQLLLLETAITRLEQIRLNALTTADPQGAANAAERRRGTDGVAALVEVPACKSSQATGSASRACNEADAIRVSMCAVIPPAAQVIEVQLFARPEDSQQAWSQSRVSAG